ncbi:MAG TPA: type ISP restriction/modification enzyme, partial [Verrucomicrobiae bacterium]|nr:type ISP restriction/modification enzyme [Verrucomicrobiae bacterium]
LEAERKGAGKVKQEKPILVILGNPPYNGFAGVSPDEEQGLVSPYKEGFKDWGITKNYLDDLYVRFFRIAERRIAEKTGKGVVCFISNHSWISDPSYVILREHLLKSFDQFWIENLHGNRKISEYAPDGRTSETVFAMAGFSPGIQQGVATSLWVKKGGKQKQTKVLFRDDLNAAKANERRQQLLHSLELKNFNKCYAIVKPARQNRFSFRPENVASGYSDWPFISQLSALPPGLGLNDNRAQATHDITRRGIEERMRAYFDPNVTFAELEQFHAGLVTDAAMFNAKAVRARLIKETGFDKDNVKGFWFKPFDLRWAYLERVGNLWNRIRPELIEQAWNGNAFILARRHAPKSPDGASLYFSRHVADQHVLHTDAYFIPLQLHIGTKPKPKKWDDGNGEFGSILSEVTPAYNAGGEKTTANLSSSARLYLARLGVKNPDEDAITAASLWMHALAIGYSPLYLAENADGIRQDWPRIPLPESKAALLASADLGKQVAALLDTETQLVGVDAGKIRPDLVKIAVVTRLTNDTLNLSLTAGWGHGGKGGVTMPGKGKLETRAYTAEELAAFSVGQASSLPQSQNKTESSGRQDARPTLLGQSTHDVYLNESTCWRNVPEKVWEYTIGGYQVIKKWLSYREYDLLGRALTPDEAREVTHMARRIAALILLQPQLDANYQAVKAATYDWPGSKEA